MWTLVQKLKFRILVTFRELDIFNRKIHLTQLSL